ncbi:MAG TPA: hypothetical protein DD791_12440 [Syntrophomonas sp.]|nr:hypothetical protein [Syntrophomonas sp.]
MQVNASNYQPNACLTMQSRVQGKSDSAVFTVDNSGTASKDASKDIWAELGSKYNVRHATFDELCEIAHKLYSAGQISFGDMAIMTFDWKRAADDLRKGHPDVVADLNLVPADSKGRRDWIAEFDARAKSAFSQGNNFGYIHNQRLADILRRINGEKL